MMHVLVTYATFCIISWAVTSENRYLPNLVLDLVSCYLHISKSISRLLDCSRPRNKILDYFSVFHFSAEICEPNCDKTVT